MSGDQDQGSIGAQDPIQVPLHVDGQKDATENITFATTFAGGKNACITDLFSSMSMFCVFSVSSTATGAEPEAYRLSARRPQQTSLLRTRVSN